MTKPLGLLLSCFDYSPVAADEFHDWYDTEHIPERQRVPGFLDCRRWLECSDRPVHVATYDLASIDVLRSPQYLAIGYENNGPWTRRIGWNCIKLLRLEGEQIFPGDGRMPVDAGALLVRGFNVASEFEAPIVPAFEHFSAVASAVPGFLCARLFRATASTHRYAALLNFETETTPHTAEWRNIAQAAWNSGIGAHERDRVEIMARQYVRTQS